MEEENAVFKYETRVRYEDLDADGYVKPNAVIGFMQNTAVNSKMHFAMI